MNAAKGRRWAYVGASLGAVVSIAANVAHSFVPPEAAASTWRPHTGAVLGAMFWPVAVVVSLEILARIEWPEGRRWLLLRWGGLAPVGLVAAVVSYRHLSGLLAFYGEDPITAALGPLAVDGLMVLASGALLVEPSTRRTARRKAPTGAPLPVRVPGPPGDTSPVDRPDRPPGNRTPVRGQPDISDLLLPGQAVARDLARQGTRLTRPALTAGLRARGHSVSTARAAALLASLKAPADTATAAAN